MQVASQPPVVRILKMDQRGCASGSEAVIISENCLTPVTTPLVTVFGSMKGPVELPIATTSEPEDGLLLLPQQLILVRFGPLGDSFLFKPIIAE